MHQLFGFVQINQQCPHCLYLFGDISCGGACLHGTLQYVISLGRTRLGLFIGTLSLPHRLQYGQSVCFILADSLIRTRLPAAVWVSNLCHQISPIKCQNRITIILPFNGKSLPLSRIVVTPLTIFGCLLKSF